MHKYTWIYICFFVLIAIVTISFDSDKIIETKSSLEFVPQKARVVSVDRWMRGCVTTIEMLDQTKLQFSFFIDEEGKDIVILIPVDGKIQKEKAYERSKSK